MAVAVRRADAADLEPLADLFDRYRRFYRQAPDRDGARRFLADRIAAGESVLLIAEEAGEALGFVQLYPSFSSVRMVRTMILNDLFVAEAARGRGVARALLAAAEDAALAAGAASLSLSTGHDNQAAQALYRATGWTAETAFITFHRRIEPLCP